MSDTEPGPPPENEVVDDFDELEPADDEVPVIGDDMLHNAVEFEAGMSAAPLVSIIIIAACLLIFACELFRGAIHDPAKLLPLGALAKQKVVSGEVWRLFSAIFLHGDFDHLLGNLIALYILGMAAEHAYGRSQFLTLFVFSGLTGALLSLTGSHRLSVGASGAIFGLSGAMVVLFVRNRRRLHLRDRRIGGALVFWAAYMLFLGLINPRVDNLAHVGGFLGGAVMALLLRPALLVGKEQVAAHPVARLGVALAVCALLATAVFFVPRLLS
jgi:rhomboid protease GluP